jgi:hypothetical protein
MTITGFKHLKSNLKKKERLNAGITVRKTGDIDVVSKSARSKSSRKSSRRASSSPSKHSGIEDEDESDVTDYRDIEQPPMNEEIEPSESEKTSQQNQDLLHQQRQETLKQFGNGVPTAALDPRNYAFVPS